MQLLNLAFIAWKQIQTVHKQTCVCVCFDKTLFINRSREEPGLVAHAYNPNNWEAKKRGSRISGQFGFIVRLYLKDDGGKNRLDLAYSTECNLQPAHTVSRPYVLLTIF